MSLGMNIYRLRIKSGMSQDVLAEKLGVSRQSVSKWETDGAVPELEKLVRLAELFGVSLDELVRDIRPEESSVSSDNAVGSDRSVGADSPGGLNSSNSSGGSDGSGNLGDASGSAAASSAPAVRKIVGAVLISTGILLLLLLLVLGGVGAFLVGLFLALPLIGCGVICMVCRKRVGLWCGWMVFVPVDAYLQLFTGSGRGQALASFYLPLYRNGILTWRMIIPWILVAAFVGLIALTLWSFRNLRLPRNLRTITLLAVGWVLRLVGLPAVMDLMARRLLEKLAGSGWMTYGGIYATLSFVMGRIEDVLLVFLLVYTAAVLRRGTEKEDKKEK